MINTFTDFFQFIWKPKLEKDPNKNILHRIKVFTILLVFSFFVAFFLLIIIGMLTAMGIIDQGEHVFDDLFEKNSALKIFFLASVMAPVIEELIFRGPLTIFKSPLILFKNPIKLFNREIILRKNPLILFKNPKTFKFVFYSSALLFGYVHISNFEISTNVLLFSPILVAPQIYLGLVLGYIRVRFGLISSILMHAAYNGILVSISLLAINALK
jgi:membrane protease YdiL (CAAX protease family)